MRLDAFDDAEHVAETHISRLVAVGDRVYKRKLPRAFGFVDQRSLADRRHLCELEVELNRRISPAVYLGVEPIEDASGVVVDYAVVMRRMPRERALASMLTAGTAAEECLTGVARVLADFHARAARSPAITAAGTRDAVGGLWRASLDDLATFEAEHVDHARLDRIGRRADAYLSGRGPLFAGRARRGLIVDGHGDLLTPDIYCMDEGPQILDCLEFDERFRYGDVLLDVAFLVMDLHWRGHPELAAAFTAAYHEFSGEHHPSSLLAHFVAYRALVRAKVALYRVRAGSAEARTEAESLLDLTDDHLDRATVRLVLVGGLPGTGKTTVSDELAAANGWATINTDAVRRELTGGPSPAPWMGGAYSPEMTQRIYGIVTDRAGTALALGESVVVDASFHDPARRASLRELGRAVGAEIVELRCATDRDVADSRLLHRDRSNPSDATPAVAAEMARSFASWPEATTIDTNRPVEESVRAALAVVLTPERSASPDG